VESHSSRMTTLFEYNCECGAVAFLQRDDTAVRCNHCAIVHPVSPAGVIDFIQKKTDQSAFFDTTYSSGHLHKIDELNETSLRTYQNSVGLSLEYLKMCGRNPAGSLENLSILDVACGAGGHRRPAAAHHNPQLQISCL